jgi:putative transposase
VKNTALVTTALKMALWRRDHEARHIADGLIHHSDAGSQYTFIAFAKTLHLEGIAASIGSVGDAYDNALAESTIGLFKTEVIGRNSPFRCRIYSPTFIVAMSERIGSPVAVLPNCRR